MEPLPTIPLVDSPNKFHGVVYEQDENLKKNKIVAYLNQIGLIDYNQEKLCVNGHQMNLKKNMAKADGFWWRCAPKACQKSKSFRAGTFFFENRLPLWQVLLLIFNFAFEFLNSTVNQLIGVSSVTIAAYKRRLRLIILTMYDKKNQKIGGEGK